MERFDLPEGWEWRTLGEVAHVQLGKTPRRSDYRNAGIKIIKFRDISARGIDWANDEDGYVNESSPSASDLRYLKLGDVLLTASAHSAESIGKKTCLVRDISFKCCAFVGELLCARATRDLVVPEWILSWFISASGYDAVSEKVDGVHLTQGRARDIAIPIAPLPEQKRLVARIEAQIGRVEHIRLSQKKSNGELRDLLAGYYAEIVDGVQWLPMAEVAPLVRRRVKLEADQSYSELGIRSFGKGTFHKPALTVEQLGNKRIFHIHPGDLLFNNVFAWEGAVAVAKPEDCGRVGSHRFITCVPKSKVATAPFLYFHFITERGLHDLGDASPGGAGRNRTLGLTALGDIKVPVPDYEKQVIFTRLLEKVEATCRMQAQLAADLSAYVPALLAKAFRGEL